MTHWAYGTLALGSALALFIYPHTVTGALASGRRDVIKRNAALLPAYSLLLGLLALLGYLALARPDVAAAVRAAKNPQLAVPLLFDHMFPSWFAGVAFAAIGVGALVPAAIMSIAASNLFTRNVYTEFLRPDASPAEQTRVARIVSLLVKVGALVFVLAFDKTLSINLQLLGGHLDRADVPLARASASTPAGSTAGRCSRAGRWPWSTAPSPRTGRARPRSGTSPSPSRTSPSSTTPPTSR